MHAETGLGIHDALGTACSGSQENAAVTMENQNIKGGSKGNYIKKVRIQALEDSGQSFRIKALRDCSTPRGAFRRSLRSTLESVNSQPSSIGSLQQKGSLCADGMGRTWTVSRLLSLNWDGDEDFGLQTAKLPKHYKPGEEIETKSTLMKVCRPSSNGDQHRSANRSTLVIDLHGAV